MFYGVSACYFSFFLCSPSGSGSGGSTRIASDSGMYLDGINEQFLLGRFCGGGGFGGL